MSDNTKVTIIVDGLGKQEIILDKKSATAIYVAASQGIIDKLITKDKPEHKCSCGGSCQSQSNADSKRGSKEDLKPGVTVHERIGHAHIGDKAIANPKEIVDEVALSNDKFDIKDPLVAIKELAVKELSNEVDKRIISELNSESVMACRIGMKKSSIDLDETSNGEDINELYNKPYPFTHEMFSKPLLVAYRCPDCGKITVRYLTLGETNEARCHWCKETAVIEKVVQSNIQCTSCDTFNRPYLANGLAELECVKCKAPIDIIYYKDGKKDRAKSANLI